MVNEKRQSLLENKDYGVNNHMPIDKDEVKAEEKVTVDYPNAPINVKNLAKSFDLQEMAIDDVSFVV